jgi:hypothetical protein
MKKSIVKRFKILCLLCLELDVLVDKMQELGDNLDKGHPEAIKALSYYEDEIIKLLEDDSVVCDHDFIPINNDGKHQCRFCNEIEEGWM